MFNPKEYSRGTIKKGQVLSSKLKEVLASEKGSDTFHTKYAELYTTCKAFIEHTKTIENYTTQDPMYLQVPKDILNNMHTNLQSFTEVTNTLFPNGDTTTATEIPKSTLSTFTNALKGILMTVSTLSKLTFVETPSPSTTSETLSTPPPPPTMGSPELLSLSSRQTTNESNNNNNNSNDNNDNNETQQEIIELKPTKHRRRASLTTKSASPLILPMNGPKLHSIADISNTNNNNINKNSDDSITNDMSTTTTTDTDKSSLADVASTPRRKSRKERVKNRRSLKSLTLGSGQRLEELEKMLANEGSTESPATESTPCTSTSPPGNAAMTNMSQVNRRRSGSLGTVAGSAIRMVRGALEELITAVNAHKQLCEDTSTLSKATFSESKKRVKGAYDEYLRQASMVAPEVASDEKCRDLFDTFFALSGPFLSASHDDSDIRDQYLGVISDILDYRDILATKIHSCTAFRKSGSSISDGTLGEDDFDDDEDDDYFDDFKNALSEDVTTLSSGEMSEVLRKKDAEIANLRKDLETERASHKVILQKLDSILAALTSGKKGSNIDQDTLKALASYVTEIYAKERSLAEERAAFELERKKAIETPRGLHREKKLKEFKRADKQSGGLTPRRGSVSSTSSSSSNDNTPQQQTTPRKMSVDSASAQLSQGPPPPTSPILGPPPPTSAMLTSLSSSSSSTSTSPSPSQPPRRKLSDATTGSKLPSLPSLNEQSSQPQVPVIVSNRSFIAPMRSESKLRSISHRSKTLKTIKIDEGTVSVPERTVSSMAEIAAAAASSTEPVIMAAKDDDGSAAVAAANAVCRITVCEDIREGFKEKSTFKGIYKLEKSVLESKLFSRTLPVLQRAQNAAQDMMLEDRLLNALDLHEHTLKIAATLGAEVVRTHAGLVSRLINKKHSAQIDHKKALEELRKNVLDLLNTVMQPLLDNASEEGAINACTKVRNEIEKMNITGPELANKVLASTPESQRQNVISALITSVANRGVDLVSMTSCLLSALSRIPFFYIPHQAQQLHQVQQSSASSLQQLSQHYIFQPQIYTIAVPLWEITTYAYGFMNIVVSIASEFLTVKLLQELSNPSQFSPISDVLPSAGLPEDDSDKVNVWDREDNSYTSFQDGTLKTSTLNHLITTITPPTLQTPESIIAFTKIAIMTLSTYSTPGKFLDKLIERFNVPSKLNSVMVIGIRNRVLVVTEQLIEYQYDSLDDSTLEKLDEFIDGPLAEFDPAAAKKVKYNLSCKVAIMRQRAAAAQAPCMDIVIYPGAPTPMDLFLESDETVIAQQLTLISFKIFAAIQPKELLDQAWIKPKLQYRAPNVIKFQERTALLSKFIGILIMSRKTPDERAAVMDKILKIMGILFKLNNFNDLMALYAGFVIAPINRLNVTKSHVDPKNQKVLKFYDKVLAPLKSFKQYRRLLEEATGSIIPILSVTLNDLTFMDEGNPDNVNGLINFEKRILTFDAIMKIQNYQKSNYNFPIVEPLHSILHALPTCTEAVLYDYSLNREPRNALMSELSQMSRPSSRRQSKMPKTLR